MKYLCMVYVDEHAFEHMSDQERHALDEASLASDQDLAKRGKLILAQALQPPQTATTVRVRNGKLSATDGPFAETIEHLGGFILIEALDLNEAIQIAGSEPIARFGSIEVRPVLDLEQRVEEQRKGLGTPTT